jgi:hypothetical protein
MRLIFIDELFKLFVCCGQVPVEPDCFCIPDLVPVLIPGTGIGLFPESQSPILPHAPSPESCLPTRFIFKPGFFGNSRRVLFFIAGIPVFLAGISAETIHITPGVWLL